MWLGSKRDLLKAGMAAGVGLGASASTGMALACDWEDRRVHHGAVLQLETTPHLWISDFLGIFHWAGDTRALAGKYVDWSFHHKRWMTTVRFLHSRGCFGDPWLSAGLLKDGDPIYLVKWETHWERPQLLHIQSILDVGIFGINETNYGKFVLDKAEWERRYGFDADTLEKHVLPSTVPSVFDSCYQAFVLGAKDFYDSEENVGYYDWMVPSANDHDGDRIVCENARGQSRLEADQRGT